jgi:hypothetical protein
LARLGIDQSLDSAVPEAARYFLDAARFTDKRLMKSVFIPYAFVYIGISQVLQSADDSQIFTGQYDYVRAVTKGCASFRLCPMMRTQPIFLSRSQSDAMFQLVRSFVHLESTGSSGQVETPGVYSSLPSIFELSRGRPFIRRAVVGKRVYNANHVWAPLIPSGTLRSMIDTFAGSGILTQR